MSRRPAQTRLSLAIRQGRARSMTRILLAMLGVLPPLAVASGAFARLRRRVPLCANLLGICIGRDCDARPVPRHGTRESGGCCAAIHSAAGASIPFRPARQPQRTCPTNHYHRKSGSPSVCHPEDRKLPLPEIRNPNLESQGSGGGGAGGGDFRSLILFTFLALAALMVYQYFQKPAANAPASQTQQQAQPQAVATGAAAPSHGSATAAISAAGAVRHGGCDFRDCDHHRE